MSEPQQFRVGICACTQYFRGQLQGQRIILPTLFPAVKIEFLIEEVVIPEKKQMTAIRKSRCHCFIDVHTSSRGFIAVFLSMNRLVPQIGRREELFTGVGVGWQNWQNVSVAPSPQEILESIRAILQGMGLDRLEPWLAVMTPPGGIKK